MNKPFKREPLNKVSHNIRTSQVVLSQGVGCMVDFPDQSLMVAAPETWETKDIHRIYDGRLEKMLNVKYFGMPKGADESRYGISFVRFPEWYFCPKCRDFKSLKEWKKDYNTSKITKNWREVDPHMVKHVKCPKCRQDLVSTRIITVCEDGHIDDFPWVKWVHAMNIRGAANICNHPKLKFKTIASASGLGNLIIECSCGARASFKKAFDSNIFERLDKQFDGIYDFKCTGNHPWKHKKEKCSKYPVTMQRGGSSVYFPVTKTSLVIPPYSDDLTQAIVNSDSYGKLLTAIETLRNAFPLEGLPPETVSVLKMAQEEQIVNNINSHAEMIHDEIAKYDMERIKDTLNMLMNSDDSSEEKTITDYKYEEYEALSGRIEVKDVRSKDFKRVPMKIDEYKLPYLKQVVLIEKIREVQALIGFTRREPAGIEEDGTSTATIVSVKNARTEWYPGYEVRGEGLFLEFDDAAINRWIKDTPEARERADLITANYHKSFFGKDSKRSISAKFLLLHTLSHLLIKQLSFECGYNISSLKERIYCNDSDGKEMCGIFIYTAGGDSEGTLGGLVRQGRSDTLPKVFRAAVENAKLCSNDPVCNMSRGQGRDALNLAACYSCTLLPETCCEERNVFLDRSLVVGTFDNPELGLFYKQICDAKNWIVESKEEVPKNNSDEEAYVVTDYGIDYRAMDYQEIWEGFFGCSEDDIEWELADNLIENAELFQNKEKPYCASKLKKGDEEAVTCGLLWEKSHCIFFLKDDEDRYNLIKDSDWTCFFGGDDKLTVDAVLEKIKEK